MGDEQIPRTQPNSVNWTEHQLAGGANNHTSARSRDTICLEKKMRKRRWSPEEDERLINYMMGKKSLVRSSWNWVAKEIGLQRCGKSCRLRWTNYLRPGLKRAPISYEEEQTIIHLHSILGNRWSQIAAHLRGRTDNEIKNYWKSCIKSKLNLKPDLLSSSTEANSNNNTKWNIPWQSDDTRNTNSVCASARDPYISFHSAKPLGVKLDGHMQSINNIFNAVISTENQHYPVEDLLDLKQEQFDVQERNDEFAAIDVDRTNHHLISCAELWIDRTNDSFTEVFTSPPTEAQGHTIQSAKSSGHHQLLDPWATLLPPGTPGSANNDLGCTVTIPALVEISDSLEGKIENDGHIIYGNDNDMMVHNLSFTASTGKTAWRSSNSYSNAAEFSNVYPGAESYPADNSLCQFSGPAYLWANVDQYFKIESQDKDDCKDLEI